MTGETNENDAITTLTGVVMELSNELRKMTDRIQEMDERQRTIMVGWNAFLKSAESQLKAIFRGKIPAPMLRKLAEVAFRGVDEAERRGH